MVDDLVQHLLALGQREQGLRLLRVAQRGHHDLVEEASGSLDHLEMAVVEGVERPGEQGDGHEMPFCSSSGSPAGRTTVTSVPP